MAGVEAGRSAGVGYVFGRKFIEKGSWNSQEFGSVLREFGGGFGGGFGGDSRGFGGGFGGFEGIRFPLRYSFPSTGGLLRRGKVSFYKIK